MAVYNYTEGIDRPHVEASQSSNSTIPFPKGEKVPSVEPSIWHRSPKERKYGKPKDKIEKKKMQLTSTTIIIERKTNGSRQNLNSSQELFSFSKIGRPRPFSFSKIGRPRPFSFILGLFKTTQILQQINVKNVDPVSGAWIRTHNLQIMSLLLQKNITRPL